MCAPGVPSYEELAASLREVSELSEATVSALQGTISALQERIALLEAEITRLRSGHSGGGVAGASGPPAWVKPNKPAPALKGARKKRDRGFSRRRQEPTEVYEHAPEFCPDCERRLSGGWLHSVREVIEIPVMPARVIHYRIMRRHCGVCRKSYVAKLDISDQVVGRHRFGVRLMSLVAHLYRVGRMSKRAIRSLLKSLHGLDISLGSISGILHAVARRAMPAYERLADEVRGSPYVHADETGWREDGVNGFVWSFSTPTVRLFALEKSRGHQVPERILGSDYAGILCSDFYSGYSYHLGEHQWCWVHLLRDLKALCEEHPQDGSVLAWARQLRYVYDRARAFAHPDPNARLRARRAFQIRLEKLGQHYAQSEAPQRRLAMRLLRFAPGLFTFVQHPDVPSHNNPAERAVRPIVIARKVSGGTRSRAGSTTAAILMSVFGTWTARHLDPLDACRQMLTSPAP